MSGWSKKIALPNDSDGFASFECPHCEYRFKLSASEVIENESEEIFCPSCGLSSEIGNFITKQMLEAAQIQAINMAQEAFHAMFKDLERSNKPGSSVQWKAGSPPIPEPDKVLFGQDDLEEIQLPCCNKHLKVETLEMQLGIYCPYCGNQI